MSIVVHFSVYIFSVIKFYMEMTSWVDEAVTYLEDTLHQLLFIDLGMVYVTVCDKVKAVVFHQ